MGFNSGFKGLMRDIVHQCIVLISTAYKIPGFKYGLTLGNPERLFFFLCNASIVTENKMFPYNYGVAQKNVYTLYSSISLESI